MNNSHKVMLGLATAIVVGGLIIGPRIMMKEQVAKINWLEGTGEILQCEMICVSPSKSKVERDSAGCVNTAHFTISWTAPNNQNYPIYYDTRVRQCSDFQNTKAFPVRYAPQPISDDNWPVMVAYDWAAEQLYGTGLNHVVYDMKKKFGLVKD